MSWQPAQAVFNGEIVYEIPADGAAFEFALYPNRYLAAGIAADRELIEAYSTNVLPQGRETLRRQGALLVTDAAEEFEPGASCKDVFKIVGRVREARSQHVSPASLSYNPQETVVTVGASRFRSGHGRASSPGQAAAPAQGCRTLRLRFMFTPPFAAGNFGTTDYSVMHFSGPIFPLPKFARHEGNIAFTGRDLVCGSCALGEDRNVLRFRGYPVPLHFFDIRPAVVTKAVAGLSVDFMGGAETEEWIALLEPMIAKVIAGSPFLARAFAQPGAGKLVLYKDILIKNLVQRHRGEIQLGAAFMKIPGWFQKYHEAAFIRALAAELTFMALQKEMEAAGPASLEDTSLAYALSRWMAEERVRAWFTSLEDIESVSDALKFIPFFRDILEGRALINNAVFLGKEEGPNPIDTQPYEALFPTFTGLESEARAKWCLGEEAAKSFNAAFGEVYAGRRALETLLDELAAAHSARCGTSLARLLGRRTLRETFSVDAERARVPGTALKFSRKRAIDAPENLFMGARDPKDVDHVQIQARAQGEKFAIDDPWAQTDSERVYHFTAPDESIEGQVVGPTSDRKTEKHIFPRRVDFMLTGIKVGYNSSVGTIEGQQGVMWRVRGDDFGRSVVLQLRKEDKEVWFDSGFAATVPTGRLPFFPVIQEEGEDANFPFWPRHFPLSLGFQTKVQRDTEVDAHLGFGLSSMTDSIRAPIGLNLSVGVTQSLVRERSSENYFRVEFGGKLSVPLATLVTGRLNVRVGRSTEPEDIGGSGGVPGYASDALQSTRYAILRNELRWVAVHDLKLSLLNSVLFEDIILFASHNTGVDTRGLKRQMLSLKSIQSIQAGVEFYGAFLGAKNQSISANFARSLENVPKNSFSFTIGKDL